MKESNLSQDCFVWFHNTYPQFRGCYCLNLNNSRNKIQAAWNKSSGLVAGRSDIALYLNETVYLVEFKTEKGRQSVDQKKWQKIIESHGYNYYIIRHLDEFKEIINKIIIK